MNDKKILKRKQKNNKPLETITMWTRADWDEFWYNSPEVTAQKEEEPNVESAESIKGR